MPIHPISAVKLDSIDNLLGLFRCFQSFLPERLKLLPFLGKAPIEELDQVEAETVNHPAHQSHGEVDAVAHEQDQQAQQQSHAARLEGGCGQPVESLCEFDRRQSQSEQTQVAQSVAKRLGESSDPFEPVHGSAKQLGWSQTEWPLPG